jgi:hypothetical protein
MRAATSEFGTSRTSGDVRLESAKWAKADIGRTQSRFYEYISYLLRACAAFQTDEIGDHCGLIIAGVL